MFLGIVTVLTVTPGADTLLLVRSVARGGKREGWPTLVGNSLGLFVHGALAGLGLSAVLVHSAVAYGAVQWAGALYLVGLGGRSLWLAWRGQRNTTKKTA